MRALCRQLDLRFDRHFVERWSSYAFVTGDVSGSRGGFEIQPVPRRPAEPELLDALQASSDYTASLELLGYTHPCQDALEAQGDSETAGFVRASPETIASAAIRIWRQMR